MAVILNGTCDNCKRRICDGDYHYCDVCYIELQDQITKLQQHIVELKEEISAIKADSV